MTHPTMRSLALCAASTLFACDLTPADEPTPGSDSGQGQTDDGGATSGSDGSETGDSTAGEDAADETGETGGGLLEWSELAGPCGGSATNAMWFDDPSTGFAGCGENADGEGLFTTIDGGATWDSHSAFNEVRTMDIRRGPDGVLYGAGTDQLDGSAASGRVWPGRRPRLPSAIP